jgi:phospholipid transport system substrate-binding protein
MKQFIIGMLLTLICTSLAADHLTPEDTVRETTNEVLQKLNSNRADLETHPAHLQLLVREFIIPHFDFDTMSRLVLGRYWKELSDSQQICFTTGFHNTLVERYAYILLSYDNQPITYTQAMPIGRLGYMSVGQTITLQSGELLHVEFPMRPLEDGWKVIDLIIDDISLVRSYRIDYQEEIRSTGIANFIQTYPGCP